MIPSFFECAFLWDTYRLPKEKITHVRCVADTCMFFADQLIESGIDIDKKLLYASALLHDIDKNIKKRQGERHPETAVRIFTLRGMKEVASVIKTHSLYTILEKDVSTFTWEQKILYLSDKMVKYNIIGVDKRFELWLFESLPEIEIVRIKQAYPKVKMLEKEVCGFIHINPSQIAQGVEDHKNNL